MSEQNEKGRPALAALTVGNAVALAAIRKNKNTCGGAKMKSEKRKTKDLFVIEALKLFSERGYEGVSVAEIAKAVGCSAPALYKHYGNKQELFDEIIRSSDADYEKQMHCLEVDFNQNLEIKEKFVRMTEIQQTNQLCELFLHTLHGEFPSCFRKLLMVEQFKSPQMADIYNQRYIIKQIAYHENLFSMLMQEGKLKKADPKALALQYISPIVLLIELCDRDPSKEEYALHMICSHVRQFNQNYRIETSDR